MKSRSLVNWNWSLLDWMAKSNTHVNVKQLCYSLTRLININVNRNLSARALRKAIFTIFWLFANWHVSLYIKKPRNFLFSSKQLYMSLLFLSDVHCSKLIDWLIFEGEQILVVVCIWYVKLLALSELLFNSLCKSIII